MLVTGSFSIITFCLREGVNRKKLLHLSEFVFRLIDASFYSPKLTQTSSLVGIQNLQNRSRYRHIWVLHKLFLKYTHET